MNINSKSEYLWFKILEIAYIKSKIISKSESWIKKWKGDENNPLDITIDWEMLESVEWGDTIETLQDFLSENSIVQWCINWYNIDYWRFEKLNNYKAPEMIIENTKTLVKSKDDRINRVFDLYWTWFIAIELSITPDFDSLWSWVKKVEWVDDAVFFVNDVKVIDKFWQELNKENLKNIHDILRDKKWNRIVKFITRHAYSVWKCYVDKNWEKRVRVVNPWHTGIKFDLSLEQCKKLFNWEFWVINIDNLFR